MAYDCGFTQENHWFRYRAAGIIVENGCVLFAGNAHEDYLYSIGGAVQMGEKARDAAIREVYEETGIPYEVDRLAVIHENFFDSSHGALNGLSCHEITFYFLMKPRGTQQLQSESYTVGGVREEMHWIPISKLDHYKAYPTFLKAYLQNPYDEMIHIVSDERKSIN